MNCYTQCGACRGISRLLAALAAGVALVLASAAYCETRMQPGDVQVKLKLLTSSGTITAGEPLIARVDFINQMDKSVRIRGNGVGPDSCVEVLNSEQKVVASTPRIVQEEGFHGVAQLAAHETRTQYCVVSGLYQFVTPGTYTIRITQFDGSADFGVVSEASGDVQVLPKNAARLDARCEEI